MFHKLTVCVVAYKNYEDIKNMLLSLTEYTSSTLNKHIYIVDNGAKESDSKSVDDFKNFVLGIPDAEYIGTNSNLGFGRAHNLVINSIDSDYHAILNPDIVFCEDSFSKIVDLMDQDSSIGMAIPLITDEIGRVQDVYRRELTVFDVFNRMFLKKLFKKRSDYHSMKDMDLNKPFNVPFGQGSFLVIRTEIFKQLNGFDEEYFMYVEDADLCKRVNQISNLMFFPGTRVIHKWEKGSHRKINLFRYHLRSMKHYFSKWGYRFF